MKRQSNLTTIALPIVKPIILPIWAGLGGAGNSNTQEEFVFNGVDQFATFPEWGAEGKPRAYTFTFIADAVATGTEQVILSGEEGGIELAFYLHATLPTLTIHYRSDTGTQAVEGLLSTDIEAGTTYTVFVENLGTGSMITVNGVVEDLTAFAASDGLQPPLTHIGARWDTTAFFGGKIWTTRMVDLSPIHDTYANMGDGNRYGELEQAIVLEDDFEISFDWIRQDAGGLTSSSSYIVSDGTNENRLFVNDTTNTLSSNVLLFADNVSQANFAGAMDDVATGQHVSCKWTRVGNVHELFIDDVSKGTIVGGTNTLTIDNFYGWAAGFKVNTGSALQNIVIKDLTQGLTWNYPLDEGPTTDTGPELISGAPTTVGGLVTWDGSTLHLEGTNSSGTFEGAGVVDGGDYHVTFDYNTSAANTYIRLGGGGNIATIPGPAIGTFDNVLNAQGTGYVLNIASDNNSGDFTNFSVKSATGGAIIHNVDPSTGSDYNGAWTPDTDWQFIDDNSRAYPMNEGDGATLKAYDGNGIAVPADDATIQNYTDNWE